MGRQGSSYQLAAGFLLWRTKGLNSEEREQRVGMIDGYHGFPFYDFVPVYARGREEKIKVMRERAKGCSPRCLLCSWASQLEVDSVLYAAAVPHSCR